MCTVNIYIYMYYIYMYCIYICTVYIYVLYIYICTVYIYGTNATDVPNTPTSLANDSTVSGRHHSTRTDFEVDMK